jgi:hypothetical protein
MKWRLLVWLCALSLLGGGCKDSSPAPRQPPSPQPALDERHVLSVEGTTVRYNGQVLPWDAGPERWQQVLGPRSRLIDEELSVWDELGVFLYHQGPKTFRPPSFEVLLSRSRRSNLLASEPEHWPAKTFTGRLVVDGAVIGKDSTIFQINQEKTGPDFLPGYLDGIYSYNLGDFYVRLDYGQDGLLKSFSISSTQYKIQ